MTQPVRQPLFDVRNVSKQFGRLGGLLRGESTLVRALDDVNVRIERGEAFGVVGESGSGKTTLGRILTRLEEPTSGQVLFESTDLSRLRGRELLQFRSRVQMIFQNPFSSLNPRRTVRDAISAGIRIHRVVPERSVNDRLALLLERVGLHESMLDRYPHQFSGGQRQRIVVARALSVEPDVLVADEPVSALDVSIQAQVLNLLKSLQRAMHLTVVLITHDLRVVNFFSDRIGVMYLGRLVEVGPRSAVVSDSRHPYTRMLMSAAPGREGADGDSSHRDVVRGEVERQESIPEGCVFNPRCWLREQLGRPDRCTQEVPALRPVSSNAQFAACHYAEHLAPGDHVVAEQQVSMP